MANLTLQGDSGELNSPLRRRVYCQDEDDPAISLVITVVIFDDMTACRRKLFNVLLTPLFVTPACTIPP